MIPLYRADPYLASCETIIDRVLRFADSLTIFCREALFMEGGGQPMDYGTVIISGHTFPLLGITKEKGNTGYRISTDAMPEKGMPVQCKLDFERRLKIMRLHTAQHALAGSLRLVRKDILTGGMKISDSAQECTVLYPNTSSLRDPELQNALTILADHINEDRGVETVSVASETEAIKTYGDLYRPTVASGTLKGTFRLVIIDGVDANACGGTHVRSLKEIENIKIVDLRSVDHGIEIIFTFQSC